MSNGSDALKPLTPEEQATLQSLMLRSHLSSTEAMVSGASAMTDASKRRQSFSPERMSRVSGYSGKGAPSEPWSICDGSSPMSKSFKLLPVGEETKIKLPPGVEDMKTWGRTVLEIGKYADKGWTYDDMQSSSAADVQRYCKWCKGHVNTSDGVIHDFGLYLLACDAMNPDQRPVIPGTSMLRKLR